MTVPAPDPAAAALALASHHLAQSRPDRALDAIDGLDPGVEGYWAIRAAVSHDLERYDDAVKAARKGLQEAPDDVRLQYVLASGLFELNFLAAAERVVLTVLRNDPTDPSFLSLYARMLASGGQLEKASNVISAARRHDPEDLGAMRTQAYVLWVDTRDREAAEIVRKLLADNPDDAAALMLLSTMEADEGAHQQSFQRIRRALGANPGLYRNLGEHMPERRAIGHALMKPVSFTMTPHGPAVMWLAAIAAILLGAAFRSVVVVGVVAALYLLYALYGHVVYRTLRWYYRR